MKFKLPQLTDKLDERLAFRLTTHEKKLFLKKCGKRRAPKIIRAFILQFIADDATRAA